MKKIFYLSTCSTCLKILKEWDIPPSVYLQDIKKELYSEKELDEMEKIAGSYEALFSKRSQKYKPLDVANKVKQDKDYKTFLLQEYSFLKRPVLVYEEAIFIGNAKQTTENAKHFLLHISKKFY